MKYIRATMNMMSPKYLMFQALVYSFIPYHITNIFEEFLIDTYNE